MDTEIEVGFRLARAVGWEPGHVGGHWATSKGIGRDLERPGLELDGGSQTPEGRRHCPS